MFKQQTGYTLSPKIPRKQDESLKIADVACGTAQWLVDLATELPETAVLDGFDLSTQQFPHQAWLAKNINLAQLDILGVLPAELIGAYDIVHVGLVVTIARGNPTHILKQLLSMLSKWGSTSFPALCTGPQLTPSSPPRTRWLLAVGRDGPLGLCHRVSGRRSQQPRNDRSEPSGQRHSQT